MPHLVRSAKQLGNIIRSARKKAHLTQMALSNKSGLRQETISLIENGNAATRIDTILRVIAMLDLDLEITARKKPSLKDLEEIL